MSHDVCTDCVLRVVEPELSGLTDDQGSAAPLSLPPRTGDRPPLTQQSRVSFAEGTTFEREKTGKSPRKLVPFTLVCVEC